MKNRILALILIVSPALPCVADGKPYTLFNPTPRDQMREMTPDRPDTTESPYTVDAGHAQVESTLFGFAKEGGVESYSIGETDFRLGLATNIDMHLIVPFFEKQRGGDSNDEGIGDLTVRLKWNLWGNDGGGTALALLPYVKTPTASHDLGNDEVEGGLIIPLAINVNDRLGLGLMAKFDIVHDDASGDYSMDFVNSVTCGFALTDHLSAYLEFVSVCSAREGADWEGYVDAGLTFSVTDDLVIDAGVNLGVNDAAQDFAPFVGFSFRY